MTKLTKDGISYSSLETRAFAALPKSGKPLSTNDIVEKIYNGDKDRPYFAQQSTLAALKALSRKMVRNKEEFSIKRSERSGPHPVTWWIE